MNHHSPIPSHKPTPFSKLRIFYFAYIGVFGIIYLTMGVSVLLIPNQDKFLITYSFGNLCLIFPVLYLMSSKPLNILLDGIHKIIMVIVFFLSMMMVYVLGLVFGDPSLCFFFLGIQTLSFVSYCIVLISEETTNNDITPINI